MKKTTLKKIITVVLLFCTVFACSMVFAEEIDPGSLTPTYDSDTSGFLAIAQNVMGWIRNIAVIAGVIILMVIGVKFMMGSAEEKAEYKKSLIPLVVGIIIVIAATQIVAMLFSIAGSAGN